MAQDDDMDRADETMQEQGLDADSEVDTSQQQRLVEDMKDPDSE